MLKKLKYLILAAIAVLIWGLGSTAFDGASPWDAFAQLPDFQVVLSSFTVGMLLLTLITIGAVFVERFFCRYLCPLGALLAIISKFSVFKINMPKNKCGGCRECTKSCSMGISLNKKNEAKGGECINCLKCIEACPRRNAQPNVLNTNVNAVLAVLIAICVFSSLYAMNYSSASLAQASTGGQTDVNQIASQFNSSQNQAEALNNDNGTLSPGSDKKYRDGTYTGSGIGFRGGTTKVSVTIANGKITDIKTISTKDTPRFYQRVESSIMNAIKSSQSPSVDVVSGATYSSEGIMNAVQDALNKADSGN